MLYELSISNFAIIEESTLTFERGLNALTGETGAGKSILLDALGAVLGQRTSSDLVRTGARAARVEAAFHVPDDFHSNLANSDLAESLEIEDDVIILAREISANGRSTARLNGRMVPASQLAELGALLVDIHGQSDHLSLLRPAEQRNMLDRYAELGSLRRVVQEGVRSLQALRARISDIERNAREREQRLDLLKFQVSEIEAAELAEGEDENLTRERDRLQHAERLQRDALGAVEILLGDEMGDAEATTISQLRTVLASITDLASIDSELAPLQERATEIVELASDLGRDLRAYGEEIEADPARVLQVDERLALIQSLRRKYGETLSDIVAFGAQARAELDQLEGDAFNLDTLREEEQQLSTEIASSLAQLSEARRAAGVRLAEAIESSISELRMGRASLRVDVTQSPDPHGIVVPGVHGEQPVRFDESGIDHVEFMIAPNVGEALRPLGRIASGGETARLMLAIKSILSRADSTPTLVFDEIDVGVGGRSANVVGEKLASLKDTHQVIVISHLPQIAAFADHHLRIEKQESDGRVVSTVKELDPRERIEELAAMLDGYPVTETSRSNAKLMLSRAASTSGDRLA